MEEIKKALETIALKNSEGVVPDDLLIKACDAYKIKSDDFLDDYEYHVCVAKSLYDHLNGIEPHGNGGPNSFMIILNRDCIDFSQLTIK